MTAHFPTSSIFKATSAVIFLGILTIQNPLRAQESSAANDGFKSLFDGSTLTGWEGNQELWSVQDGAITGITTADTQLKHNQFITWTGGELTDFELKLKFRIEGGNSGIQFRSQAFGESGQYRVGGYQADIDSGMRYMGILYEERGRGILAERSKQVEISESGEKKPVGITMDDSEIVDAIDVTGWNEYTIRAEGNQIQLMINGKPTVKLTDQQTKKAASSGLLAFQIHVGPPMKIQFKDIYLKNLGE